MEPEGRGNAGSVESVENQTQVFHASHSPLKIPQTRRDFHIPTASVMTVHSLNQRTKKRQRKDVGALRGLIIPYSALPPVERDRFHAHPSIGKC